MPFKLTDNDVWILEWVERARMVWVDARYAPLLDPFVAPSGPRKLLGYEITGTHRGRPERITAKRLMLLAQEGYLARPDKHESGDPVGQYVISGKGREAVARQR